MPQNMDSVFQYMSVRLFYKAFDHDQDIQLKQITDVKDLPAGISSDRFVREVLSRGQLFCVSIQFKSDAAIEVGVRNPRQFSEPELHTVADKCLLLKSSGSVKCYL